MQSLEHEFGSGFLYITPVLGKSTGKQATSRKDRYDRG